MWGVGLGCEMLRKGEEEWSDFKFHQQQASRLCNHGDIVKLFRLGNALGGPQAQTGILVIEGM